MDIRNLSRFVIQQRYLNNQISFLYAFIKVFVNLKLLLDPYPFQNSNLTNDGGEITTLRYRNTKIYQQPNKNFNDANNNNHHIQNFDKNIKEIESAVQQQQQQQMTNKNVLSETISS